MTLDKPPISCSVQTDRLDGASRHFQAMLKADKDSKSIWWGTGQEMDGGNCYTLENQHGTAKNGGLKDGFPFHLGDL